MPRNEIINAIREIKAKNVGIVGIVGSDDNIEITLRGISNVVFIIFESVPLNRSFQELKFSLAQYSTPMTVMTWGKFQEDLKDKAAQPNYRAFLTTCQERNISPLDAISDNLTKITEAYAKETKSESSSAPSSTPSSPSK